MASDKKHHVTNVFGDPRMALRELIPGSSAIQNLNETTQKVLLKALHKLPEDKQVQALQELQKEKGALLTSAQKSGQLEEEAYQKLTELKRKYTKKKQDLFEEFERREESEEAESLIDNA